MNASFTLLLRTQVFKLYVFSRSVNAFVETLEGHNDGEGGGEESVEALIKDKFVAGFKKLSDGFALFQQVGRRERWHY